MESKPALRDPRSGKFAGFPTGESANRLSLPRNVWPSYVDGFFFETCRLDDSLTTGSRKRASAEPASGWSDVGFTVREKGS